MVRAPIHDRQPAYRLRFAGLGLREFGAQFGQHGVGARFDARFL
jgi:hypothetical protein